MSWFGETFGESLSSLKGQITKITKEVLAENDNESEDGAESARTRDGDSASASAKDSQIRDLKEENRVITERYEEELELLRRENDRLRWSFGEGNGSESSFLREDQIRGVCELENQLQQLKIERDHLEELQKDHQSNICLVINQRDGYKRELEQLKRNYSVLEAKYEEVSKQKENEGVVSNNLCEVSLEDSQNKDDEVSTLRGMVEKLQTQIEAHQSEREETSKAIERHMLDCRNLSENADKLTEEIRMLNVERERIEGENRKMKEYIETLTCDLNKKTEESDRELERRRKLEDDSIRLKQMLDLSKAEESNYKKDVEIQVKNLMDAFGAMNSEQIDQTLSESFGIIKDIWEKSLKERMEYEDAADGNRRSLQSEVENLKEVVRSLECELKSRIDEGTKMESEHREVVESLERKCFELQSREQKLGVESRLEDVERLNGEIAKMTEALESKDRELNECRTKVEAAVNEAKATEEKVSRLEGEVSVREQRCCDLDGERNRLAEDIGVLRESLKEAMKRNEDLEEELSKENERRRVLARDLEDATKWKVQVEEAKTQMEYLKAQIIIKESEMKKQSEGVANELREEIARLRGVDEELRKWKEATVDLELQRQDLAEEKEALERECSDLRRRLAAGTEEMERLKGECAGLKEAGERAEDLGAIMAENEALKAYGQQQGSLIASLGRENAELRHQYETAVSSLNQQIQQLYAERASQEERFTREKPVQQQQQHRRSKSDADFADEVPDRLKSQVDALREQLQKQVAEYKALQEQHAILAEKEARSKKELERLRLHLIEIEDDYTETIDEYKTKLSVTEEQLKNSSTFYTSTKVRDNQHLESLQSQIRLISAQRDDLQRTLSAVEDEVQKHKAALASFHVVLEQFQQDKEREIESLVGKHESRLQESDKRLADMQAEMNALNAQLSDAKNGLKAASRLGEQLERKNDHISRLEEQISGMSHRARELEETAAAASQSTFGKVDKSLVKNLVVGYVSSQQADRKAQVLRILASVLDFDAEEKSKIGVDNSSAAGWLSSLLSPRVDGSHSSQSLSEAFITFLENESRPRPQVKLLPEQRAPVGSKARASGTPSPKPSLLLQELVLPTFSSPQTNESTILKDVLKES